MRDDHECKFAIGDEVRIRNWDDMEEQFGTDEFGQIQCDCIFPQSMRKYCGVSFVISNIRRSVSDKSFIVTAEDDDLFSDSDAPCNGHWLISTDMIEPMDDKSDERGDEFVDDDYLAILRFG